MNASFTITVEQAGKYLRIRLHAPVTRELARQFAIATKQVSQEVGCGAFLFDVRGIANVSSVSDNYDFVNQDMTEIGVPKETRAAILINLTESTHDFSEIAMRAAGYNVHLFSDERQAIAWLGHDQYQPAHAGERQAEPSHIG